MPTVEICAYCGVKDPDHAIHYWDCEAKHTLEAPPPQFGGTIVFVIGAFTGAFTTLLASCGVSYVF